MIDFTENLLVNNRDSGKRIQNIFELWMLTVNSV
jgi:hypothetical protein